jgi:glycosyltransferase involved in cell wall biosynthesis
MKDDEFCIFEPNDCEISEWFQADNIRFLKTPIPSEGRISKFIKEFNFWSKLLAKEKFDVFECFNIPTTRNAHGLSFHTIHDIRSLHVPSSKLDNWISKLAHDHTIQRADKIITVSNTMKKQILNYYPEANINYIYNGIDIKKFTYQDQKNSHKSKIVSLLPERFLLAVGHFEKRKNYINLIKSIKILKDRGEDYFLVIVGNDNGEKKSILNEIEKLGVDKNIQLFSNLSDAEVRTLYSLCSAFIFPSIYEGFGIPIIEAMAYSKPFILSNLEVFKEITENQGVYFDPLSPESIANVTDSTLNNSKFLNELAIYGKKRVADFDFKNLATQIKKIYSS